MASPKIVVFTVFNVSTGVPAPGLTPTFTYYKDETGTIVTPPTITELGGGNYAFTPAFSSSSHGIVYVLSTGANPTYLTGYLRPEDFFFYEIDLIRKLQTNKWSIVTTGADTNKMVFYDDDGTTPILKVALTDAAGSSTAVNPYTRTPTS